MAKLSSSNGLEKRPKLRFPEFKEPWNLVKLEDVCSYRKGRAKVKKAQYVSTENILQNYAGIEPYDDLSEAEGISIQCGDTLMANIRPYLKKVWQSNFNGACSTDVLAFSPDNIDGKFLYFLIAQNRFVNYVMCGAKGSKMPRGDKNHILEYETGVPTESEQRKIAHFIDLLNARISSQNSLINLIKKYKRGSLSALFPKKGEITPQYRFAGFTKPWEQRKLGELALFNPKDELPQTFEYVDLESVVGTEMLSHRMEIKSSAPSRAQRLACTGDIFYQTVRPYQKNNYLFEMSDNNYVFSTGYAQMRPFVDGYFLFSLIQSERFVKVVLDNCTGTSYPAINVNDLAKIEVAVPSGENEAHKIGTIFRSLDRLITLHQHKYDTLLSLKNALLQQMFI